MVIEHGNELRETAFWKSRNAVSVRRVSEISPAQEKAAGDGGARRPSQSRLRRKGALMDSFAVRAQNSAAWTVSESG